MRKSLIIGTFFVLAPITLLLSLSLLSSFFQNNISLALKESTVAYAALPPSSGTLKPEIVEEDARVAVIRDFFQKYKSPLIGLEDEVVQIADKYGLDYRLIPAIAMQESNLCKKIIKDSYNCWGFGIYGKKVTRFDNYEEGIDTVTKTLATKYKASGLETPEEIMKRYTPGSNGSWAFGVNHFMNQLAYNL